MTAATRRGKFMEKTLKMFKSLPINLILASQEKPQLLILATEHGAHSLFGSRDETVLAKKRSSSSVGKKKHILRGKWEEETQPAPRPSHATQPWKPTSSQSHCHSTNIYRPLFSPKHLRPEEQKRRQKPGLLRTEGWQVKLQKDCFRKKLHYGHQSKVGEGFHIHKDFSRMGCDKSTKSI